MAARKKRSPTSEATASRERLAIPDLKPLRILVAGEVILDNRKVILLELLPKTEEVKRQLSKIQLWLDESTWLPVQQQFFETGSGDYFIIRYRNMNRNVRISDNEFKPHWPHGTTKMQPPG